MSAPNAVFYYCANCGRLISQHYTVNFADGPNISGPIYICPTAVYVPGAVAATKSAKDAP